MTGRHVGTGLSILPRREGGVEEPVIGGAGTHCGAVVALLKQPFRRQIRSSDQAVTSSRQLMTTGPDDESGRQVTTAGQDDESGRRPKTPATATHPADRSERLVRTTNPGVSS